MNITRDVVRDLLPLYASGEASADTRALVDFFLKADPGLATEVASMREDAPLVAAAPVPPMAADRKALERTRHLLRQRTGFFAAAIFFTMLPLSVRGGDDGVRFIFSSLPVLQASFLSSALVFWIMYAVTRHKMRVSGL